MRTRNDRLRHAIGFEFVGLLIAAPLASWFMDVGLNQMGPLALFFSLLATIWNYIYNIGVDKLLLKHQGHTHKTLFQRVLHTFGFEAGLLIVALPVMSWWLNVSMLEALVLDLGFVAFYLVYAFIYNWGYDKFFPVAQEGQRPLRSYACQGEEDVNLDLIRAQQTPDICRKTPNH